MKRSQAAAAVLVLPFVLWLPRSGPAPQPAPGLEVDVLVYGATSAGVIAAYTAKQYGNSVLLVEPGRHVGGMSSGGLGHTDIGNKYAVTGLGLDFYRRLGRYYGRFEAWQFEPRAAEQVFESYLDEADVEILFSRRLKSLSDGFIISRMPNGKTDWNNRGGFSTDFIGRNWDYPEADYAGRARIWREHEEYQKGLLHFIATDARVPEHVRTEMQSWGYCRDEFLDTGGWPHQLYVREARRLIGEYVMTEHNAWGAVMVDDGVGMAAYTMDSHNAQRVVVDGQVKNEGNVEVGGFPPYPIAYRALTPRRTEVTNLLVPVALSATHIVYGSIRMEPVFMVLAQATAVAASMAIREGTPVQQVDVRRLQRELRENPLADGSVPEVLIDDRFTDRVRVTGRWSLAEIGGRYGPSVLRSDAPEGSVRFIAPIAAPGTYTVLLYWPAAEGLASNAPVGIRHADGIEELTLDLRRKVESIQHGIVSWMPLGEFRFAPGAEAWLEIRSDGADGAVLADAVLFVPIRTRK